MQKTKTEIIPHYESHWGTQNQMRLENYPQWNSQNHMKRANKIGGIVQNIIESSVLRVMLKQQSVGHAYAAYEIERLLVFFYLGLQHSCS